MTPSLPAPNDLEPDNPDEGASAPIVHLKTASQSIVSPPRQKKARPAARATPRKAVDPGARPPAPAPADFVSPGPPPPLPADLQSTSAEALVIPPRPPLPSTTASTDLEAEVPEPDGEAAEPEAEVAEPEVIEPDAEVAEPESDVAEPEVIEPDADAELADTEVAPEPALAESESTAAEVAPETVVADVDAQTPAVAVVAEPDAPAVLDAGVAAAGDVLELRGITKRFGDVAAVDGIDLTIPAGTFYGLVGPNGAGKTTTLSMIAGLLSPDRGTIRVGGIDAASDPRAVKRMMGVLPDRLRTFDRLTGRQLLYYYGVLRGLKPAVAESRTADLARAFDLTDALGRVVSDYSAGMLKKVMLAGALIHSPRLLVLDEPFEAVDPVSSAVIIDILNTYVAHGGTVVLSSHGMELVERMCSRVAVIVAGQVLAEGTVDEVRGELTLEQRFVELAGGLSDVEGLEWLHTFSD